MYDYYDYEEYYEPSAADQLFTEFQEKFKELILNDTKSKISTIVQNNEYYKTENDKLYKENLRLKMELDQQSIALGQNAVLAMLLGNLRETIKNSQNKNDKVYTFLDLLFQKDYDEDTYELELWLGALTQFYSHKDEVLAVLRLLDFKLPDGVEDFRLPLDWDEKELDVFLATMPNHSNCNGCYYERNLRYWRSASLRTPEQQCNTRYSEIPWQYILRNPLLKKEKYLVQIGQNASSSVYNWNRFWRIDQYLDLTEDEIKTILSNIDCNATDKKADMYQFVLRHLKLVENEELLDKVYDIFKGSYDFRYKKKILDMPYKYIMRWVKDYNDDATSFVKQNKDEFTAEQYKELMTLALDF